MESIQANIPILARASEFSQEAKRRRELEQQTAAKAEITPNEPAANRVTFSQEAQFRLSAERTQVANRVKEVRHAAEVAADEARSKAIRAEKRQAVEAKAEDFQIRKARDSAARQATAETNKAAADIVREAKETVTAVRKMNQKATVAAIEQQNAAAKEQVVRKKTENFSRMLNSQIEETQDFLDKQKTSVIAKNMEQSRKDNEVAAEHVRKYQAVIEHSKAETAKATKMYQHVDAMGRAMTS